MHFTLIRIYGNTGTNGYLIHDKKVIAKTIELPWRRKPHECNHADSSRGHFESCIPEGFYHLRERYSPHFGRHLEIMDVPGRDLILFHPANDARRELRGCIAPVTELVGPGLGTQSRLAMRKLMDLVLPVLDGQTSNHPRIHAIHRVAPVDPVANRTADRDHATPRVRSCNHAIHRVALTLTIQT